MSIFAKQSKKYYDAFFHKDCFNSYREFFYLHVVVMDALCKAIETKNATCGLNTRPSRDAGIVEAFPHKRA